MDDGVGLRGLYIVRYVLFEALGKLLDVFNLEREACSIGVAAKVVEQVAAAFDGFVYVEIGN